MTSDELPVLYSFRRCPYAMRARLALKASRCRVELREVVLRDKPEEMILASPKATVPVLVLPDGTIIDESIDVMHWALSAGDLQRLKDWSAEALDEMEALIEENDGSFKSALDRYKYPNRYNDIDRLEQRDTGTKFIQKLNELLGDKEYLFGERFSYADAAILPFVRQFAHVDREWFWLQEWHNVIRWLDRFLESNRFKEVMEKYPQWKRGETGIDF